MKKTRKKMLMASAAVAVMGMSMASGQAYAFDKVAWEWNKTVTETVAKNVTVDINNEPSGMVELEKIQTHVGDVTAHSTVTNVQNNPPEGEGAGPQSIALDEPISITASYDDNAAGNPITNGTISDGPLTGSNLTGSVDNNSNTLTLSFDLSGEIPAPQATGGANDAIDLPKIASLATAVGNNQQIDSDVSLDLHDGQFLYGGYSTALEGDNVALLDSVLAVTPDGDNTHTDGAAFLTFAGALGLITPAAVTADSTVNTIANASIDSQATAIGNNMDVALNATTPADALMMGDVTQVAYADVSATSTVDDITIDNYAGMGAAGFGPQSDPQIPLVNSTATAVGNNFSVKVTSPSL